MYEYSCPYVHMIKNTIVVFKCKIFFIRLLSINDYRQNEVIVEYFAVHMAMCA